MTTTYKYASTEEVRAINAEATELKLNRALRSEAVEMLDPEGAHMLLTTYALDDGATYRHEFMFKMIGQDEPVTSFIDTRPMTRANELVENLPKVDDLFDEVFGDDVSQPSDTLSASNEQETA